MLKSMDYFINRIWFKSKARFSRTLIQPRFAECILSHNNHLYMKRPDCVRKRRRNDYVEFVSLFGNGEDIIEFTKSKMEQFEKQVEKITAVNDEVTI